MELISLIYTSRCAPQLTSSDVDSIHRAALTYNPLDGVTGLLVYNGNGFMQVIEGAESAIDDLMARITADVRHVDLHVRDRQSRAERCFAQWNMYRIDIDSSFERGLAAVEAAVAQRVDASMRAIFRNALAAISLPA